MKTPRTLSPYLLVQEFLRDEPWKLLCAVIMLNQTSAKQVWPVLPDFFEKWPRPLDVANADEKDLSEFLKTLGLQNRRAKTLRKMSEAFLFSEWKHARDLPGIGKYGDDSYRMFVEGYLIHDVKDKELQNYVRWAEENSARGIDGRGNESSDDVDPGVRGSVPAGARVPPKPGGEGQSQT
jgi:methyl-CpG-binding domain protein 4